MSVRVEISTGRKAGWSIRHIARELGRDPSVISRRLARNSTKTTGYRPVTADVEAQRRCSRPQQRKMLADAVLRARVDADLRRSMTPRQVAGRLQLEHDDPTVERTEDTPDAAGLLMSHEAVYQYIYALARGELARKGIFLASKRTRRKPRTTGRKRQGPIVGMVPLSERDAGAIERRVPRHWEGDLIIGKNGTSCAATPVERMSGMSALIGLHTKCSDEVADAIIERITDLPELMRGSLAWDQGSEMAQHARVSEVTRLPVYFADPHSPWQRPANENTNRLFREYLPKGTTIPNHQPYLTAIADEINNRPRARLGFLTPVESYQRLLRGEPHVASTT